MNSEQFEQDRKIADERLAEAVAASKTISDETARMRAIQKKINAQLAARDIEWEKMQWWTQNIEALHSWAASGGKLPKLGTLETSETELKILKVALDQVVVKLLVLDARAHASRAEELEVLSRLKHIDALESHFKVEQFLQSGAEIIGGPATVNIDRGAAELLQIEADELLKKSISERERAEEIVAGLASAKKGGR